MHSAQKEFLASNGCLQLRGFHPKARVAGLRQKIVGEVQRLSAHAGAWKALHKLPVFQQIAKLSAAVQVPGLHEVLVTPDLMDLVAEAGGQPSRIQATQLLLSPPHQGTWTLEGLNWHVDLAASGKDRMPGLQAFFLIDDVAPHGGATLALAGSHCLGGGRSSSSGLRDILRTATDLGPELQELGVHIVEMSGRAGDVFLMDLRVLHTPSINSTKHIRMMATCRFFFEK